MVNTLTEYTAGTMFINTSQLAKALGVARETAAQMVYNLRYLPNGREKLYLIKEVAQRLYSRLECDGLGVVPQ